MSEKTIALTGAETEVHFSGYNAWLRNDGAAAVYASKTAGVAAGSDGVISIPAGGSAPVYGANGTVFLLGSGSVQIIGSDYATNPFKTSTSSGGSAVDDVARTAIDTHAGNAEIHVTADEKEKWNNKAELSDIPSTLPANGGNADTVDGLHASSFFINNKPHVTSVTSTESSIHLKWLPVDGATKYAVSKYNDDTSYNTYSSDITDTEYTITGLTAGTEYSILVQAYINGAWTTFSTADHIIVRTNMFSSGTSASSFLQSITSDLLTRSINDVFAGTYSVEQSYTPDFPTGFGTYGILDSRIHGSIQYQTIWFDTGVIIHRERIIDTIDWSTWQKINDGGNAATLESHPASDFVLKSDYDALAARVAALEGN